MIVKFILITVAAIIPLFLISASAGKSAEDYLRDFEQILPDSMGGLSEDGAIVERFGIEGVLSEILSSLNGEKGECLTFLLLLIGGVAVFSLASGCSQNFARHTETGVGLVVSLSVFPTVSLALSSVVNSLDEIGSFFNAMTPIVVGVTALGGGASTSAVQASGMYTSFTVIGSVGREFFVPIASFGLSIATLSALGSPSAISVGKGIKGIFTWLTGIFTTVITSVFALQSLVSSAADSAAMRTAKYMASGLIPIVGTAVSGALATLASGLSYAKSLIGGGAIAVIISLAISPLVILLFYRFALTLASIFAELVGATVPSKIYLSYRFVIDMTVTVYTLSVIVYLFQIILFLRTEVALL